MARKPARKTEDARADAEDGAQLPVAGDGAGPDGAAGSPDHIESGGENSAGQPAETPDVPPEGHAAAEGGEALALPADPAGNPGAGAEGNALPTDVPTDAGANGAGGPADGPMIVVTCLASGGRRRLNRRWPEGQTRLPATELSEVETAILRGDPRFLVAEEHS